MTMMSMKWSLLMMGLVALAAAFTSAQQVCDQSGRICFQAVRNGDQADFTVTSRVVGWAAMGFGTSSMKDCDIIVRLCGCASS